MDFFGGYSPPPLLPIPASRPMVMLGTYLQASGQERQGLVSDSSTLENRGVNIRNHSTRVFPPPSSPFTHTPKSLLSPSSEALLPVAIAVEHRGPVFLGTFRAVRRWERKK